MALIIEVCSNLEDMEAVVALQELILTAAGMTPSPRVGIEQAYDRQMVLTAKLDDRVVGYYIYHVDGNIVDAGSMGVDPIYQRQGIGMGILDLAREEFLKRGICFVKSYTVASQESITNFVTKRKHGYQGQETINGVLFNVYLRDVTIPYNER